MIIVGGQGGNQAYTVPEIPNLVCFLMVASIHYVLDSKARLILSVFQMEGG
mgnify:CR=1 FL=1